MIPNLMNYALSAAEKGLCVFAGEPGQKTPIMVDGYRIHWSDVASCDMTTVASWWNRYPDANPCIACKASGLLVVDCDMPKDGSAEDGLAQFAALTNKYGKGDFSCWKTYTVITGSGGTHFYYRWPRGAQASQSSLTSLVDIRSNGGLRGGYVLGAGSITHDYNEDGSIAKEKHYTVDYDTDIQYVPTWLFELCKERPKPKPVKDAYAHPRNGNFAGLADFVRLANEGNRNNALAYAVRCMVSDGASLDTITDTLGEDASIAGLAENEIHDTIRSCYRLQHQKDGT